MTLPDLLAPLLAAFATGAALLLVSAALSLRKPKTAQRMAVWIAPSAAFLTGSFFVRGFPRLPPVDSAGWLLWAVAIAGITGALSPQNKTEKASRFARTTVFATVLAFSFLLLKPLTGNSWNVFEAVVWIGGTAVVWFIVWLFVGSARHARRPWQPQLLLATAAIGLAILLTLSGTLSYGLHVSALVGTVGASALWAAIPPLRKTVADSRPAPVLFAIPWAGFLFGGFYYAELPIVSALLALFSLTALALPAFPKLQTLSPARLFPIQLLWLLFPLFLAILWAGNTHSRF